MGSAGRPSAGDEARRYTAAASVTLAERQRIQAAARAAGVTVSQWMRAAALAALEVHRA